MDLYNCFLVVVLPAVSIPKRVLEVLDLKQLALIDRAVSVSIPKRVLEVLDP